ncbi:MAG: M23 family metallopeptidase [Rhodothermales bacterium]|nr:M23 family metallopeptidase [Rhodothermales bacterium]
MRSFFSEFFHDVGRVNRVIFIDDEGIGEPRQYRIRPIKVLGRIVLIAIALVMVTAASIFFTPLREMIPGYGTEEMRRNARLNALRLAALEDSVQAQSNYVEHIRKLMTGQLDVEDPDEAERGMDMYGDVAEGQPPVASRPVSADWTDHGQPAVEIDVLPVASQSRTVLDDVSERYLASMRFPTVPPVQGFRTQGFEPRIGHYGVDIAVEEGTVVRAVGDGYVIFADWTYEGGHAIAIQHAKGYISVYKHNQRLLKNVGDRVRESAPIALSGNSGEISTGPHLHFELWQNGLAQDPNLFFLSL